MSNTALGYREMPPWRVGLSRMYSVLLRLRRRYIPYLVWYDQEVDVTVTFTADKLPIMTGGDVQEVSREALRELWGGPVAEIENNLSRLGIGFDKGLGREGRDWEWDWSLKGPISVRFRRRTKDISKRAGAAS